MGCDKCGASKYSPEFNKRFKGENNSGCGVKNSKSCDSPSLAAAGSPRAEWEAVHGKLITHVTRKLGDDGRFFLEIIRIPCEPTSTRKSRHCCCSLRYRVAR